MKSYLAELLQRHSSYLLSKISKIQILGDVESHNLREVFVELEILDQRDALNEAEFAGNLSAYERRRLRSQLIATLVNRKPAKSTTAPKARTIKPMELLRRGTRAIVTGSPGCGKTTLFKYLALQEENKGTHLVIWLELKALDRTAFLQAGSNAANNGTLILIELWLGHLKSQLSLSVEQVALLREECVHRFKNNCITVLLDGFDELQDELIERSLNHSITQYSTAIPNNTILVSTRPYAQHKLGKESFRELEIQPLSPIQIKAFLNCYYPNDVAANSLLVAINERSTLRELLHTPLLLGVLLRLQRENRFPQDRLKVFETITIDLTKELDRSKSVIRGFKINNLKLRFDFLKFLAFELMLVNPEDSLASRIVFSYDLLKEKARIFITQERLPLNPRDLADDALATPLLREIAKEIYAFSHLTVQEYLAACALVAMYERNRSEALSTFFVSYFNSTVVEVETLPMMLAMIPEADEVYEHLNELPESLTLASLRLRGRGIGYGAKINTSHLSSLYDTLTEIITDANEFDSPYREIVITSFSGLPPHYEAPLVSRISTFLKESDSHSRWCAARALTLLDSPLSFEALIAGLSSSDQILRGIIASAVRIFGSEFFVHKLLNIETEDADLKHTLGHIKYRQLINHSWLWDTDRPDNTYQEHSFCRLLALLLSKDSAQCQMSYDELARRGEKYLQENIERGLECDDLVARRKAIQLVGYYSTNPGIVGTLGQMTSHDDELQDLAMDAIVRFGHKLDYMDPRIVTKAAPEPDDNLSKAEVLVHEVGLIVASAGHFFREVLKFDEGIDGEIEFRNSKGRGSGKRVYLQLKSGYSHLRSLANGTEVFYIEPRHAVYWVSQAYDVLLVIRNSHGIVRWMNVSEYLRVHGTDVKQVEFRGEIFDKESVHRLQRHFAPLSDVD